MIAVTGAAGFIGSVLVWKLNQIGLRDILAVDQEAKNSPKWDNLKKKNFDAYYESDEFIGRLEKKEFDGKIRAVFHMGACSDTTETDRAFLRKNNSEYSERVARWCLANGAALSYASSAAVYGDGAEGFSDGDELAPRLKPLNPYGQSKLDFDRWVLGHGHQDRVTGFRFFNVYGPNEYHKGPMRSLVQKGFEQIRDTGTLRLFKSYKTEYPDGGQKRDFLYVKDAVDALVWFYQNPKWRGIYNLGAGRAETWNELARSLFEAMGKPPRIEYIPMPDAIRNQYQYFTQSDSSKLKSAGLPVRPRPLREGIADYVANYLSKDDAHL
ncbi:MAG: ADP-glyceromanno-heptose 6-epimerase [Candidatus Omnitrophica bacterium]|nr:ADP-glyceromanno-heptose 6-epimerase [Candidatus Omnitrophota bacterium]